MRSYLNELSWREISESLSSFPALFIADLSLSEEHEIDMFLFLRCKIVQNHFTVLLVKFIEEQKLTIAHVNEVKITSVDLLNLRLRDALAQKHQKTWNYF